MPPIMTFIGNLGYVAVCVAGAVLTMKGTIGFEVIVGIYDVCALFYTAVISDRTGGTVFTVSGSSR